MCQRPEDVQHKLECMPTGRGLRRDTEDTRLDVVGIVFELNDLLLLHSGSLHLFLGA